jgi:hypothetical protein
MTHITHGRFLFLFLFLFAGAGFCALCGFLFFLQQARVRAGSHKPEEPAGFVCVRNLAMRVPRVRPRVSHANAGRGFRELGAFTTRGEMISVE